MRPGRCILIVFLLFFLGWGIAYLGRFHSTEVILPVRGEYLTIAGRKLYINVRGEGRNILLLHGFPYNSDSFNGLIAQPWPGCRLITLDFPGLGLSEKPAGQPIGPDDLALTVKLVMDKLEIEEVDIVGHDLGGGVAVICAALYPKRVKSLVLIAPDSSAGMAGTSLGPWWSMPAVGEAWAVIRLGRSFIRSMLKKACAPESPDWSRWVERYYRSLNTKHGRQGFLSLNRGRYPFEYLSYEEQLRVRTLIIWGEKDRIVPMAAGEKIVRKPSQARLEIIPGAGHLPQEEAPEKVHRIIKEFLKF